MNKKKGRPKAEPAKVMWRVMDVLFPDLPKAISKLSEMGIDDFKVVFCTAPNIPTQFKIIYREK